MRNIAIGIDLAKSAFSTCTLDPTGRVIQRQDLRREAFAAWLAQLPAGTLVAMEACSGAHHWARRCHDHGLQARLMAAQFVKPFRKSQAAKNDRNDAEAIATAARQGNMRFVPVKTVEQQAHLRRGKKVGGLAVPVAIGRMSRPVFSSLTATFPRSRRSARSSTRPVAGRVIPKALWTLGCRKSQSTRTTLRPEAAAARAKPEAVVVLPSLGKADVKRITLGGLSTFESCSAERKLRSASEKAERGFASR